MLTILERQIAALDEDRRRGRPARHTAWLRRELPEATAGQDEEALLARVTELCAVARELGIEEERDELRFLRLTFLPDEVLHAPQNVPVLVTVLADVTASAAGRLDFLERHFGTPLRDWPSPVR